MLLPQPAHTQNNAGTGSACARSLQKPVLHRVAVCVLESEKALFLSVHSALLS